jgi:hypothetical protein
MEGSLGRLTHKQEDNIEMDLKRNWVGWSGLDSFSSEQESVAGSCEHYNEPSGTIKGRKFLY